MLLTAACDVATAAASTCAQLAPNGPTVAQFGANVSHVAHDLVGGYLDGGPLFWLSLLLLLWVGSRIAGFLLLLIVGPKEGTRK